MICLRDFSTELTQSGLTFGHGNKFTDNWLFLNNIILVRIVSGLLKLVSFLENFSIDAT